MDDPDLCKICRTEAEAGDELYSPCKCKGSIGKVHASCLMDWLAAANPRATRPERCEVCGTAYRFEKVYARDIPARIPITIIIKRIGFSFVWTNAMILRVLLVAFCWLGLLPWMTVWMWRLYFWSGANSSAAFINLFGASPEPMPFSTLWEWTSRSSGSVESMSNLTLSNLTLAENQTLSGNSTATLYIPRNNAALLRIVIRDCFEGQIIACAVVITFVAIFMLREWIQQQGVEDAAARDRPNANIAAVAVPAPPIQRAAQPETAASATNTHSGTFSLYEAPDHAQIEALQHYSERLEQIIYSISLGERKYAEVAERVDKISEQLLQTVEALGDRADAEKAENARQLVQQVSNFMSACKSAPSGTIPEYSDFFGETSSPRPKKALPRNRASESSSISSTLDSSSNASFSPAKDAISLPEDESSDHISAETESSGWQEVRRRRNFKHTRSSSLDASPHNLEAVASGSRAVSNVLKGSETAESDEEDLNSKRYFYMNSKGEGCVGYRDDSKVASLPTPPAPAPRSLFVRVYPKEEGKDSGETPSKESIETLTGNAPEHQAAASTSSDDMRPLETPTSAQLALLSTTLQTDNNQTQSPVNSPVVRETPAEERIAPPATAENPIQELDAWINDEAPDEDDESEAGDEEDVGLGNADMDDLDGVLEAVGLRGSLLALIQLVCLMIFLMGLSLSVALWTPFVVGRTFLLSNTPYNLVVGPVRFVRLITDPLVDFTSGLVYKLAASFTAKMASIIASSEVDFPVVSKFGRNLGKAVTAILQTFSSSTSQPSTIETAANNATQQSESAKAFADFTTFIRAATSDIGRTCSTFDRTSAIFVGYVVLFLCLAAWYVRDRSLARPWSPNFQEALRQQGILLKVTIFIIVELIGFPALCGLLLSVVSLPIFADASLLGRLKFITQAPISSVFFKWTMGTIFMFIVAQWISMCRSNLRKGALYFIRDPKDPDSHPIKEMIDAPVFVQASKLAKSVFLYSTLFLTFALAVFGFYLTAPDLFPLRLHYREPLATIPIDLLVAAFLTPKALAAVRPYKIMRQLFRQWTVLTAHQLRLSSFLLGVRVPSEEGSYRAKSWETLEKLIGICTRKPRNLPKGQLRQDGWQESGTLARVPATDSIKLIPGRSSTILVNGDGSPMTEEGAAQIAAYKAQGSAESDWTLVYLPPLFRLRLVLALYLLWLMMSLFVVASCAIPLLVGRRALALLVDGEPHDGYSIVVGAYIAYPTIFAIAQGLRLYNLHFVSPPKRSQRRKISKSGRPLARSFKATSGKILQRSWMISSFFAVGVVLLPLQLGIALNIIAFCLHLNQTSQVPTLNLPEAWAYGAITIALLIGMSSIFVTADSAMYQQLVSLTPPSHIRRLPSYFSQLSRSIVRPAVYQLARFILGPAIAVWTIFTLGQLATPQSDFSLSSRLQVLKYAYQIYLLWTFRHSIAKTARKLGARWLQSVKDSEYLLERQIQNYSEATEAKK